MFLINLYPPLSELDSGVKLPYKNGKPSKSILYDGNGIMKFSGEFFAVFH